MARKRKALFGRSDEYPEYPTPAPIVVSMPAPLSEEEEARLKLALEEAMLTNKNCGPLLAVPESKVCFQYEHASEFIPNGQLDFSKGQEGWRMIAVIAEERMHREPGQLAVRQHGYRIFWERTI